jgi:hypothetical protein
LWVLVLFSDELGLGLLLSVHGLPVFVLLALLEEELGRGLVADVVVACEGGSGIFVALRMGRRRVVEELLLLLLLRLLRLRLLRLLLLLVQLLLLVWGRHLHWRGDGDCSLVLLLELLVVFLWGDREWLAIWASLPSCRSSAHYLLRCDLPVVIFNR